LAAARIRPRLSRSLSRARWDEYRTFLLAARRRDYRIVSLESWVRHPESDSAPTLILRHDVDQHPRSALAMDKVERDLGVRSSWYFRWRTAHPTVISTVKSRGGEVGLHYETLTREALKRGMTTGPDQRLIEECRELLRAEIAAFARLFGSIRSVVPHGDSRIPAVHNADLLRGEDCADYGIEFDANEAMRGRGLGNWLTDRSAADGGWKDGIDPLELLASSVSPLLCVSHPNNWSSGPSLWLDRIVGAVLRSGAAAASRPLRTGSDAPPL